jgi:hypothetical protein
MDVFFTPLEPPIYELLGWDMDLIMRCLEVIRRELPALASGLIPDDSCFAIFAMPRGKFPGGSYPVLGVVQYSPDDSSPYLAIEAKIRTWCLEVGKEKLTALAAAVEPPSWEALKECGCYPDPRIPVAASA